MKKFLRNILLFSAPILVVLFVSDFKLSKYLAKQESLDFCVGENQTWNDIFEGKMNYEIAIYGNSRAWVQIDPKIIENSTGKSCYNFGIDGQDLDIQLLRHQLYLKNNTAPKTIIYVVDFALFDGEMSEYNYQQFLPYMFWNKEIKESTKSFTTFTFLDYYIPMLRFQNEKMLIDKATALNVKDTIGIRTQGYKGFDKVWNTDFDNAKKDKTAITINVDEEQQLKFEAFLEDCKLKSIEVILVVPPIYIEGQKFVLNHNSLIENLKLIAKKHQLSIFDYTKDSICMSKEMFYNAGHLNKNGAEIFTKKIVLTIQKEKN